MKKLLSLTALFLFLDMSIDASLAAEVKFERDTAVPMVYLNVAIKAGSTRSPCCIIRATIRPFRSAKRGTR